MDIEGWSAEATATLDLFARSLDKFRAILLCGAESAAAGACGEQRGRSRESRKF